MGKNTLTVSLLSTSDVHGFFQNWDYASDKKVDRGGLSKVSTVYKKIKKDNPHTMILDCGDLIQGNSAEVFLDRKEFPAMIVLNKIGYEIFNMGNHEFNFGMDRLNNVVKQFKGISMMGNLYGKTGERQMNGLYIKYFGPVKIAFVSLTTPLVRQFEEKRGNLKDYIVKDADVELKMLLEEAKTHQPHAIIGIFHMGDKNENFIPNTGIRDLLYGVDESSDLDAIFGGHMHQQIEGMLIKKTIFMEPGTRAEAVNRLDLTFDLDDDNRLINLEPSLIQIDENVESDHEIEQLLKPFHKEIRAYVNEYIGYVEGSDLRPEDEVKGIPQTRVSKTDISDFFLEVMLHYSKADVVATHLDNPYPQMPVGEIKRKHIYDSYSYSGGDICNYEVTVRDLKDYMEWSAGYFNQSRQGDFTISFDEDRLAFKYSTFDIFGNVKYEIDLTKPMGSRIINLRKMDDSPMDDSDVIILGLNKYRMDFLMSEEGPLHDRNLKMLWSSMADKSLGFLGTIRNCAMDYMQKLPNQTYRGSEDENWFITTSIMDDDLRKVAIDLINRGLIHLPKKDNGEIDLSVSKNIYDDLTDEEFSSIAQAYEPIASKIYREMTIIDVIYLLLRE